MIIAYFQYYATSELKNEMKAQFKVKAQKHNLEENRVGSSPSDSFSDTSDKMYGLTDGSVYEDREDVEDIMEGGSPDGENDSFENIWDAGDRILPAVTSQVTPRSQSGSDCGSLIEPYVGGQMYQTNSECQDQVEENYSSNWSN